MSKKAWIVQGGWDGHEPQLTSKRFASLLEKNGYEATTAVIVTTSDKIEKLDFNYGTVLGGTDVCISFKIRG